MSTVSYLVAFPIPGLPPHRQIERVELEPGASVKTLLRLLGHLYPGYSDALQGATCLKVGRSSVG